MKDFENLGFGRPTTPEDASQVVEGGEAPVVETPVNTDVDTVVNTDTGVAPDAGAAGVTQTDTDTFFDTFNKRYNTEYKTDDEIKAHLEAAKKFPEIETKIKEYEPLAQSVEQYKKEIDELKKAEDPLKYFASPESYIAEQLRIKYKDKDPQLLHKIATTDVNELNDFDVLVYQSKLDSPKIKEESIKAVLCDRYGIDKELLGRPEEWDELAKTKIALDSASARRNINQLKAGIEMPKVVSREERERLANEALAQKTQAIAPIRAEFSKFDKIKVGDVEYTVPDDYKSKLGDMFDAYFLKAGNDVTDENLTTVLELRDSMFLWENRNEIAQAITKEAERKVRAEMEDKLGNTQLPNTATASDASVTKAKGEMGGVNKFLEDIIGQRVKNL